ncbi:MAG: hypothetical protein WDW38_008428 [Sanguina aurantia]
MRPQPVQRRSAVRVHAAAAAAPVVLPRWPLMHTQLKTKGLRTVAPELAQEMIGGESPFWVLVDVRQVPVASYEAGHPTGSVNVPLYQPIDFNKNVDFRTALKALAYAANGVPAIEANPDFIKQLTAAANGKGVICMCEAGGTLKPTVNFPDGKPSRSLQAAFRAMNEEALSITNLAHLERGVYGWYQADLPMDGDYTPDVGRTPSAAAEPTLSLLNQARGYELNANDRVAAPEKKKFFGLF